MIANKLGWKPKLVVNNIVASASNVMQIAGEGGQNKLVDVSISIVFLKDPNDPQWTNDDGVTLYRQIMKRYAPGANVERRLPRVRHGRRLHARSKP